MEKTDRMEETITDGEEAALKIYEVGYHILPSVAEENVAAEVGSIKGMLESAGALFISEEFPKLRALAYSIAKAVDGRVQEFGEAYFGWVKFELSPEAAAGVKKGLEANKNILRHLFIETVRENTLSSPRPQQFRKEGEAAPDEPKEEMTAEDEAKVNQAIDELVKG